MQKPALDTLTLREATDDELPALNVILQASFGEQMLKRMEGGRGVLALLGGAPVGCVVYEPNDDHVYLGRIAVLPSHQNLGIGAALVAYVEERARRLGTPRVRLAVNAAAAHLRKWYAGAGYALVEECFFPGMDEPMYIIVEKDLSERAREAQ